MADSHAVIADALTASSSGVTEAAMEFGPLSGVKVLVTGADKFLGQAIVNELYKNKAVTFPLDRSYGYDIRNEAEVLQALMLADPDVVIHAEPCYGGVPESARLKDALSMGMALVHGCALKQARLILVNSPAPGGGGFDVAAIAVAGLALAYQKEARKKAQAFDFCSVNLPNVFGPGDTRMDHPVQQISEIAIRGTAMKVSDWRFPGKGGGKLRGLYVRDAACAIVDQITRKCDGASLDFGGTLLDVESLIKETLKACGNSGAFSWTGEGTAWDEVHPAFGLTDIPKAVTPLPEAIQETVAWCANLIKAQARKA